MEFSKEEFKLLLETDYWLLENVLTLPSDPSPTITNTDSILHVQLFDTFSMKEQQGAILQYRNKMLPAIFVIAQKIYAELFRLVLANNNIKASSRQVDIQNTVREELSNFNTFNPFLDFNELNDWWEGTYNFNELRLARNQMMHNKYQFDGNYLKVSMESEAMQLYWSSNQILNFLRNILEKTHFIFEK